VLGGFPLIRGHYGYTTQSAHHFQWQFEEQIFMACFGEAWLQTASRLWCCAETKKGYVFGLAIGILC
jgi:hypothetical protein